MQEAKVENARIAVNDRGTAGCGRRKNEDAVLVLAKFTLKRSQQRIFCLTRPLVDLDPEPSELRLELLGGMEDDPCHPEAGGSLRIGCNVVDIYGFLRPNLACLERLAVDDGVRLACADVVRIDADGEEAKEGEAGFLVGHVDGIGIREQR